MNKYYLEKSLMYAISIEHLELCEFLINQKARVFLHSIYYSHKEPWFMRTGSLDKKILCLLGKHNMLNKDEIYE